MYMHNKPLRGALELEVVMSEFREAPGCLHTAHSVPRHYSNDTYANEACIVPLPHVYCVIKINNLASLPCPPSTPHLVVEDGLGQEAVILI